jgi:hypothetical protein
MPLQPGLFLDRIVAFLLPYFAPGTDDPAASRTEILATLESYAPRTRSGVILAARIIACGMTALDLMARAGSDLTPAMQLRVLGCANAMNRSCQQAERALERRLKCDGTPEPAAVPANPDSDMDDLVQEATASMNACRNRLAGAMSHAAKRNGIWDRPPSVFDALFAEAERAAQMAAQPPPQAAT